MEEGSVVMVVVTEIILESALDPIQKAATRKSSLSLSRAACVCCPPKSRPTFPKRIHDHPPNRADHRIEIFRSDRAGTSSPFGISSAHTFSACSVQRLRVFSIWVPASCAIDSCVGRSNITPFQHMKHKFCYFQPHPILRLHEYR